jgi:lysozyme family protein
VLPCVDVSVSQAKINEKYFVAFGRIETQTHIIWFYVAVDDASFVDILDGCDHFDTHLEDGSGG